MYQNAKLYLNSDKTGFKKVSKNWQRLHLWQIFVIFLSQKWNIFRKYSHTKTNKNMTKLYFCYIFDTILVRCGNIMETFQSKKVTKRCQNPYFWLLFVTILSLKGHSADWKATKGLHYLKNVSKNWQISKHKMVQGW